MSVYDYIFEPMPKESEVAFSYYCTYRDLGETRSIRAVLDKIGKKSNYQRSLERYSSIFRWIDRARAYDTKDEIIKEQVTVAILVNEQLSLADRRQTLRETSWQIAVDLFDKARQMLAWPISVVHKEEKGQDENGAFVTRITIEPIRWKMSDVAAMADTANRIARLAVDLPTEIIDITSELMQLSRHNEIDLLPILKEVKNQLMDVVK